MVGISALALLAAAAVHVTTAQPSCPAAGSVMPLQFYGNGTIANVTDSDFSDWNGATIIFSPSWIDIVSSSDGLVVDRLCIDRAVEDKNHTNPSLQLWKLEGTTLFIRVLCFNIWYNAQTGAMQLGFQREMQSCRDGPMASVMGFHNNSQQTPYACPWQGLGGSGLIGWGNKNLQPKPLYGYSEGSYFIADRGDMVGAGAHAQERILARQY